MCPGLEYVIHFDKAMSALLMLNFSPMAKGPLHRLLQPPDCEICEICTRYPQFVAHNQRNAQLSSVVMSLADFDKCAAVLERFSVIRFEQRAFVVSSLQCTSKTPTNHRLSVCGLRDNR